MRLWAGKSVACEVQDGPLETLVLLYVFFLCGLEQVSEPHL